MSLPKDQQYCGNCISFFTQSGHTTITPGSCENPHNDFVRVVPAKRCDLWQGREGASEKPQEPIAKRLDKCGCGWLFPVSITHVVNLVSVHRTKRSKVEITTSV